MTGLAAFGLFLLRPGKNIKQMINPTQWIETVRTKFLNGWHISNYLLF